MKCTASGKPAENAQEASVPTERKLSDGQHADHWVLCETERAKGFVRPVRDAYVHVGLFGPTHPLRDLTEEETGRFKQFGYVKFEAYPEGSHGAVTGKFWTQQDLDKINKGCGVRTTMPRSIAESYARQPNYYGSTFCCGCGTYLPVGASGEFVWDGTTERVGT